MVSRAMAMMRNQISQLSSHSHINVSVSVLNENGKGRREKKCAKRLSFEEGGTFGIITKIERIV